MSLSKWPPGGHIGFFGFQTLTLVWLWISTPNLGGTILMYMCRSLLIFSNVNFKMAARQPYWNFWFQDSNFSLALNINCKLKWHNTYIYMGRGLLIFSDVTFKMAAWRPYWIFWFPDLLYFGFEYQRQTLVAKYLCIWVRAYWFSVTSFSKWLPGGYIRFFGFWMAWFRQRNSSLLGNFSFKFHVHVLCGCGQKPNDCQLCRFQNGCLVILNNATLSYGAGVS